MYEYAVSALIFGLVAGLKPGPLGIVVIQITLEHGLKHGVRASLAPIITDGPIIIASVILLTHFKEVDFFISLVSAIGGAYLLWLSLKVLNTRKINIDESLEDAGSLATAIKINLLSPYPYLFWFTVGGTYIALGTKTESTVFVIISIGTLVLSKMLIAWMASNFRESLEGKLYLWVMRVLGLILALFGFLFLNKAYNLSA